MPKKPPPDTLDFLLVNICHLHRSRAHQLLETIGLYRGQPAVLRELWDEEGLTQTSLAERLRITPATATKMLQRMEKNGFIIRKPDASDQRVSRVYLTQKGREAQDQLEPIFQMMDAETFAGFSQEERLLLRRYLTQIRDNLVSATGEEPWN